MANLTIGERGSIHCNTDLMVKTIMLLYAGEVMANDTSHEVELLFDPVFELLHNREYICRTTSKYGTQEHSIILNVIGEISCQSMLKLSLLCVLLQYHYHPWKYPSKKMALHWLEKNFKWSAMFQPLKVYCHLHLCGGSINQVVKSSKAVQMETSHLALLRYRKEVHSYLYSSQCSEPSILGSTRAKSLFPFCH